VSGELLGDTLAQSFGTLEAARDSWARHGARLAKEYREPLRRLYGVWLFEIDPASWRHLDPRGDRSPTPEGEWRWSDCLPYRQENVLEALGLLDDDEVVELARQRQVVAAVNRTSAT
jgi:hypothetical protein